MLELYERTSSVGQQLKLMREVGAERHKEIVKALASLEAAFASTAARIGEYFQCSTDG